MKYLELNTCALVNVINLNTGCEARYFNPLTEINAKGCGDQGGMVGWERCLIGHCRA